MKQKVSNTFWDELIVEKLKWWELIEMIRDNDRIWYEMKSVLYLEHCKGEC